ncbi:hypothetical protein M794_3797 [Acinetobacter baumannii 1605]|nr:hypothetical protein ACINIS235_0245 [Acinetobacter baumannii IS-235]EKP62789.1 hypothetical protein ACINCANBC1_0296 [Acinetobacter baumannii Canada BC1]EKW4514744.1 hypothetical protein [Proteus mirabilis]EPS78540.1 hypothetical protein M794_3797 [Acinetobacter baumannii 1605]
MCWRWSVAVKAECPPRMPTASAHCQKCANNGWGKRIKWLILPLHESETDRHLIGLSG